MNLDALFAEAQRVRQLAYARHSNYLVGAALLTKSGAIYSGCNVENASYGLTICAERNAIGQAVAHGTAREGNEDPILALAVATRDGASLCGACRQVVYEFAEELDIYLLDENGGQQHTTIAELLPGAFNSDSLD